MLRAYKTPIFAKVQKLTHSPPTRKSTRDRRHHYSTHPTYSGTILVGEHYCNWLQPPLRITTPTLILYWVVLMNKVVGPNDPPVKKTRDHSAAKQL